MSMREGDAYDLPDSFITHQVTHFAGDDAAHLHHGDYDMHSVAAYRNFRERTGRSNENLVLQTDAEAQWLYISE
jgi:nitrous oxide reductase